MNKNNFKKGKNKSFWSQFFLIAGAFFIILAVLILIFVNINIYSKKNQLASQIASLEQRKIDIEKTNNQLKEKINKTGDEDYIEKVAREELGLQKEGETVISFVEKKDEEILNNNQNQEIKNWFDQLVEFLKFW